MDLIKRILQCKEAIDDGHWRMIDEDEISELTGEDE